MTFNRDQDARSLPNLIEELLASTDTLVLPVFESKFPVADGRLQFSSVSSISNSDFIAYLGRLGVEQTPLLLVGVEEDFSNRAEWLSIRQVGHLSNTELSIARQAAALANWNRTHQFCPECGSPTELSKSGWIRRCVRDGRELFPRTDPAVIVSVIDDQDRLLMGSQMVWEPNRFSVLAGFVDSGENLETAVAREVFEESGISVSSVEYWKSEVWPSPYSLMLAFKAKGSGELKADGVEIRELRWFTRAELSAEAHQLLLPGRAAIARALIEDWYGSKLKGFGED